MQPGPVSSMKTLFKTGGNFITGRFSVLSCVLLRTHLTTQFFQGGPKNSCHLVMGSSTLSSINHTCLLSQRLRSICSIETLYCAVVDILKPIFSKLSLHRLVKMETSFDG